MFPETHAFILNKSLELFSRPEFQEYKNCLIRGCKKPDAYHYDTINHFYNPISNKGLWFLSNAKKKGINEFNKAVKLFKKGKKNKAYYKLGRSLHFLMDLAIPAHTIPVIHLLSCNDLEIYLNKNFDSIRPNTPKIANYIKLESYFDKLALKSRKHKCERKSLKIIFSKNKSDYILSERELRKQSRIILKLAISYSSGLLKKFIENTKD